MRRMDRRHSADGEAATTPDGGRVRMRRGEQARQRVLAAALEILAERGLPGFTMEAVAQRAAASKTTIYSRWPSRTMLLIDAMKSASPPLPAPTTDGLRGALIELVSGMQAALSEKAFPRLLAAFIDAAEREPTLREMQVRVTQQRRQPVRQVLTDARRRGEIPDHADIELAIDLLTGTTFYQRFVTHEPFSDRAAAHLVDHVLRAVGASGS
jgi:AcrR family transcriptional regulator